MGVGHQKTDQHSVWYFYTYLHVYGYAGANPAHSDFVEAPAVSRDGKTVGLCPEDCRRLLDAPSPATPLGVPSGS
jgi:hypothetical protein